MEQVSCKNQNYSFNFELYCVLLIMFCLPKIKRIPVVLSVKEILNFLNKFNGLPKLIALLCYGTGLHKVECHRLRIKDIDFARMEIKARKSKGNKDRRAPLAKTKISCVITFSST